MSQKWVKIISRVIIGVLVLTMLASFILPLLGLAGQDFGITEFVFSTAEPPPLRIFRSFGIL